MKLVHYFLVVGGSLGVAIPIAAASFPAADKPYFMGFAAICVLVATVAGAVSDKIGAKVQP